MARVVVALAVAAAALTAGSAVSAAEEIRLRMRGGDWHVAGRLEGFDGKFFVVTIPGVGRMALRADRYECVDGLCPNRVPVPRAVAVRTDSLRTSR